MTKAKIENLEAPLQELTPEQAEEVQGGAVTAHVKAFSGVDFTEIGSFLPYPGFAGGITVAGAH